MRKEKKKWRRSGSLCSPVWRGTLVLFACEITQAASHKINLVYLLQTSKHVPRNPLSEISASEEYQWRAGTAGASNNPLFIIFGHIRLNIMKARTVYFARACLLFSDIFSWMPLLCGEFPPWQAVGLPRWQLAQWHTFTLSVTQRDVLLLDTHTHRFRLFKVL